ncbi:hypothetical protein Ddye_023248 [Dipteronia dyeriana]|uniref:Uncharacterized protein n=1 Tax=Dipteronia dyeriana TaxID=168575 RepID=A0AAD9TTK9_9ROSI|nr:hypothetical protein Ddye_023248 [Dipteronia dyeriana]
MGWIALMNNTLFIEDETFGYFIGEKDNREWVNSDSHNFDSECDIGGESAVSDHSHFSGDHDDNIVGNITTQRGSFVVPRPLSIIGSEQYSFQTISHESSTTKGQLYKGRIFASKKKLKRELSLVALKQHFEFRIKRLAVESFQRIPSYLYMLERKNPGTMTDFELDDEGRFKFAFFSYDACFRGFSLAIRHVFAIDDTHLKGRFHGILFVAA